jgi:histidine decarboxylase
MMTREVASRKKGPGANLHLGRNLIMQMSQNSGIGESQFSFAAAHRVSKRMTVVEDKMRAAHQTHLGYPYNLLGRSPVAASLGGYLVNNLGDPYVGSHYRSEVCDLEREAVSWLMQLWGVEDPEMYWGSIGASGTEGNFWAIYLAREACPGAALYYSADAHYSIPKAARILGMSAICVASDDNGAINIAALERELRSCGGKAILALTCGTTVKGAHDDIAAALSCLDRCSVTQRYVHVDGALNAMVLPFTDNVPFAIQPSFKHGIDSISTSGHKMIGTPMPCGALIARRAHVDRIASAVAYLRSDDTTLMGSRNGHAVLAMWARFFGHGEDGYRADVVQCLSRAEWLVSFLTRAGVPVLCNPFSLTVLFPQPAEDIVNMYQLACSKGEAHAVVMPNVTMELLQRFVGDYVAWWQGQRLAAE